jgi:hypothetical protein
MVASLRHIKQQANDPITTQQQANDPIAKFIVYITRHA